MKKLYQRMIPLGLAALLSLPAGAEDFWQTWGDGRAELNGYELVQPRYGHLRKGYAVLIYVTEEHSEAEKVKIEGDPSRVPASERFGVLKLNAVRHFATGIYDYNVLTSVFVRLDDRLSLSKVSTSVQEWCGHTYQQIVVSGGKAVETLHSYFGGEGDQTHVRRAPNGIVYEDQIPLLVRELRGPWLAPGESRSFPSAPALLTLRLAHKLFEWKTITVTKAPATEFAHSVLGDLPSWRWTVQTPLGGTLIYWTEAAWPHRLLKWSSASGESATLTGTKRLPYWKLHDPGDEKYLKDLGITR
jgi:hypothetical protein